MKLLQLYNSHESELLEQARVKIIVDEISIIFPNDVPSRMAQCKYVKVKQFCVRYALHIFNDYLYRWRCKMLERISIPCHL